MKKNQLKPLLILLVCILISIQLIISQETTPMDEIEFQTKLTSFETSGDLNDFVSNLDSLSNEQKGKIIEKIETLGDNTQKFWNKWTELAGTDKMSLWKGLTSTQEQIFMKEYSKYYGIEFKGFDENIGFGEGGVIGNKKFFLDAEEMKSYDIVEIEYKKDKINGVEVDVLKIKKQSGASLEVIVGKDQDGYYFKNGNLHRLKKGDEGIFPDANDPSSGKWNGNGHLIADASKENLKLTLDFNRANEKISDTDYATFTTSKGESFSIYQNPTDEVDENGNTIYELNKAEITFDENQRPIKLSNAFVKGKIGGFFGEDTNIHYDISNEQYKQMSAEEKAELGTHLIVDEENGIIKGAVAKSAEGVISNAVKSANKLKEFLGEKREKLGKLSKIIGLASTSESEEETPIETTSTETSEKNWLTRLTESAKEKATEALSTATDKGKKIITRIAIAKGINDAAKKYGINLDVKPDGLLVKSLSSNLALSTLKTSLDYGQSSLIIAENIVTATGNKLETTSESIEVPFLNNFITKEGHSVDLRLNNDIAKKLSNVNLDGIRLKVEDNRGKMVEVVKFSSKYGYGLNPDFNRNNPDFNGINFNLLKRDENGKSSQQIQIYSDDNGNLHAKGIGSELNDLTTVGSRDINARGNVQIGRGGFISRKISEKVSKTENIADMRYEASKTSAESAKQYLTKANAELGELSQELSTGGITKSEQDTLNAKQREIFNTYHSKLRPGDSKLTLDLDSSKTREIKTQILAGLRTTIDGGASGSSKPIDLNNKAIVDTVSAVVEEIWNDPLSREQLMKEGITSVDSAKELGMQQLKDTQKFTESSFSSHIVVSEDSKNNLYQLKYGNKELNLHTVLGKVGTTVYPMIISAGGVDKNGRFTLEYDVTKGRLYGHKTVTFQAYVSHPLIGALRARSSLEADAKAQITEQLKAYAQNPTYMKSSSTSSGSTSCIGCTSTSRGTRKGLFSRLRNRRR